jgi:hypothetical protein
MKIFCLADSLRNLKLTLLILTIYGLNFKTDYNTRIVNFFPSGSNDNDSLFRFGDRSQVQFWFSQAD